MTVPSMSEGRWLTNMNGGEAGQPFREGQRGGFPDGGLLDAAMFPEWQQHYLELLVSRDLPAWGVPAKPQAMMRLLAMLAALHEIPPSCAVIAW